MYFGAAHRTERRSCGNFGVGRKYAVAAGDHEIRLSEPRYEDVVKKVTISPGKATKLSETMKAVPLAKPPFGRLRTISGDKFAAVYVNGKFMGHADEFSNSMQGLQQVKIEADKVVIVRGK